MCEWESELKLVSGDLYLSCRGCEDDDDERAGSGSADHTPSTPLTALMDSSNLEGQDHLLQSYHHAYMDVLCCFALLLV